MGRPHAPPAGPLENGVPAEGDIPVTGSGPGEPRGKTTGTPRPPPVVFGRSTRPGAAAFSGHGQADGGAAGGGAGPAVEPVNSGAGRPGQSRPPRPGCRARRQRPVGAAYGAARRAVLDAVDQLPSSASTVQSGSAVTGIGGASGTSSVTGLVGQRLQAVGGHLHQGEQVGGFRVQRQRAGVQPGQQKQRPAQPLQLIQRWLPDLPGRAAPGPPGQPGAGRLSGGRAVGDVRQVPGKPVPGLQGLPGGCGSARSPSWRSHPPAGRPPPPVLGQRQRRAGAGGFQRPGQPAQRPVGAPPTAGRPPAARRPAQTPPRPRRPAGPGAPARAGSRAASTPGPGA